MTNHLTEQYVVVLYDGECGFCNHWLRWILKHKPSENIRFLPLQSDEGKNILKHHKIRYDLTSIIVAHKGKIYQKSTAIHFILKNVSSSIRHLGIVLSITPTFLADMVYSIVAKHRHRIMGNTDSCGIPTPEERKFFLPT